MQLPFTLKAGTVGTLELKMNLMSMFSSDVNSMHIVLDNVFFIVGPSIRVVSKDDSYLHESEKELLEPYDENNGFNIFTNNLKLRKKLGRVDLDNLPRKYPQPKTLAEMKDAQSLTKEQKDLVKGLTLSIKKLHLRFEDDYYSGDTPYSCGIVIQVRSPSGLLFAHLTLC